MNIPAVIAVLHTISLLSGAGLFLQCLKYLIDSNIIIELLSLTSGKNQRQQDKYLFL